AHSQGPWTLLSRGQPFCASFRGRAVRNSAQNIGNMEALSILALGAYANETLNPAAKGRYSEPLWRKHRSEERLHGRAIILVALSLNAVGGKRAARNHPVAHAVNRDDAKRCAR